MRPTHWLPICVFALAVAACAQSNGGDRKAARVHAAAPPADYVTISGAEPTGPKSNSIYVNPDLVSDAPGAEGKLTAFFGLYFLGAARDAKPAHPGVTGDGSGVGSPIIFNPPIAGQEELDMTMNELAFRHPDRRDVKGALYRSPSGTYLLYAEFETDAGSNALYYDVSRWAAYQNAKTY
jgi:hypothetical protein